MAPVNAFGAALCAAFCWPLMAPGLPSLYQLVILGLFGATNTAFAYLLFLVGGRHIPSGEAGLIAMLDVVLGPFWVWLVFAEQPGGAALLGGGLVLAAVLWYLVSQLHEPALSPPAYGRAAGMKKTVPVLSARLFFYGTLLDRELRRMVIGRDVDVVPATLPGWRRLAVAGHAYPMIRRDADASVAGVVTEPLSAGELARLRHYEGEDYPLAAVELRDDSGAGIAAALFAPPADRFAAAGEWQLADWQRRDRADILDRLRDHDWPQG